MLLGSGESKIQLCEKLHNDSTTITCQYEYVFAYETAYSVRTCIIQTVTTALTSCQQLLHTVVVLIVIIIVVRHVVVARLTFNDTFFSMIRADNSHASMT